MKPLAPVSAHQGRPRPAPSSSCSLPLWAWAHARRARVEALFLRRSDHDDRATVGRLAGQTGRLPCSTSASTDLARAWRLPSLPPLGRGAQVGVLMGAYKPIEAFLRTVRLVRPLSAGVCVHPAADPVVTASGETTEAAGDLHRLGVSADPDGRSGGRQRAPRSGRGFADARRA